MQSFKSSFYNVLVPVAEEQEYLLYNTTNGGLEILPWAEGALLDRHQDAPYIDPAVYEDARDTFDYLYRKGFLVDESLDEQRKFHESYRSRQQFKLERNSASIFLTVGTTILCNMGCSYCFEFFKPNKSLKDERNFEGIAKYLEEMVVKAPVKKWKQLNVTWYGGEPLINKAAIGKLTPMLLALCEKYDMEYVASIITNGILLTDENWQILKENRVNHVQVTLDGPEEIHDKSRPLKGRGDKTGKNYARILDNLSRMPEGMHTVVRINTDRRVADHLGRMLDDFERYGLWPQRPGAFSFKPAWMRTYEEANEADTSARLDNDDFFDVLQDFRRMLVERYNAWTAGTGRPKARLKWQLPELQEECATWVSPYGLVVDPEGNIHKCWETIHDSKEKISHVSQGFDPEVHKKFMEYDRYELNPVCAGCKFLPVCDKLSCSHQAIKEGKPPCTYWKNRLAPSLREQYLLYRRDPDAIILPANLLNTNTGHSNK